MCGCTGRVCVCVCVFYRVFAFYRTETRKGTREEEEEEPIAFKSNVTTATIMTWLLLPPDVLSLSRLLALSASLLRGVLSWVSLTSICPPLSLPFSAPVLHTSVAACTTALTATSHLHIQTFTSILDTCCTSNTSTERPPSPPPSLSPAKRTRNEFSSVPRLPLRRRPLSALFTELGFAHTLIC
jgi:hypothetical protein